MIGFVNLPNLLFFLAGAISTKYVGLFIYLYVGLHTISRLWAILGDTSSSLLDFAKYFAANFLCLILGKPLLSLYRNIRGLMLNGITKNLAQNYYCFIRH
jgi:dolichyl-phosphate-mannose--protein O-mannosyl transferase